MRVYAGIDEAGYGPMFGPMTIGASVFALDIQAPPSAVGWNVDLWRELASAVSRETGRKAAGKLPVNDSKKLYAPASGIRTLEQSLLAFSAWLGRRPATLEQWLTGMSEHQTPNEIELPWYRPSADHPWATIPAESTWDQAGIGANMLQRAGKSAGVHLLDLAVACVLESDFNRMVQATRSKAAVSFTFVARHLSTLWQRYGQNDPWVAVDRQSGRSHYRELLAMNFPDVRIAILEESPTLSRYRLVDASHGHESPDARRSMTVEFLVEAEANHLPVALASMMAKYTRELMMDRFNAWFTRQIPGLKPTAGYALDGKRFWADLQPHLPRLKIDPAILKRLA